MEQLRMFNVSKFKIIPDDDAIGMAINIPSAEYKSNDDADISGQSPDALTTYKNLTLSSDATITAENVKISATLQTSGANPTLVKATISNQILITSSNLTLSSCNANAASIKLIKRTTYPSLTIDNMEDFSPNSIEIDIGLSAAASRKLLAEGDEAELHAVIIGLSSTNIETVKSVTTIKNNDENYYLVSSKDGTTIYISNKNPEEDQTIIPESKPEEEEEKEDDIVINEKPPENPEYPNSPGGDEDPDQKPGGDEDPDQNPGGDEDPDQKPGGDEDPDQKPDDEDPSSSESDENDNDNPSGNDPNGQDEPTQTPKPKGGLSGGAIAGIIIAVIVVVAIIGALVYYYLFRKPENLDTNDLDVDIDEEEADPQI